MLTTKNTEWRELLDEMARVGRAVQRRGMGRSLRRAATEVGRLAYLREAYVWYRLDIRAELQSIPLPAGLQVAPASSGDLELLEQIGTISGRTARRRVIAGAELWIARHGQCAAFSCWVFRRRLPALAGRRGWLELPPGTAGLDDSIVAPAFRQQAIAAAAWCAVARSLAQTGVESIVAKVEETNLAGRRAIELVGFRAVASMQLLRIGGRTRVAVHVHEESSGGFLVAQLAS